jgi:gluconokinase
MIIILIGVAGSGKTTLGEMLAARLRMPFLDADELHTPACAEQMRRGEPLTDAQRDAWLDRVLEAAVTQGPGVLACSALRLGHRERLRAVGDVRMFMLDVPVPVLERRLRERSGHFFPARLLQSQLETLETPEPAEGITMVDARRSAPEVLNAIIAGLETDRVDS